MQIKLVKKILTIVSVVCVIVAAGILVGSLLGIIKDALAGGPITNVLISSAILAGTTAFAITAVGFYKKQKVLSIITLALLLILTGLLFYSVWGGKLSGVLGQISGTLALLTIPFCSIVDNYTKLGKKSLVFQVVTYIAVIIAIGLLIIAVWGVNIWVYVVPIVIEFVVAVACWFVLLIIGRHANDEQAELAQQIGADSVVVKKEEYDWLKARVEQLTTENFRLKQQLGMVPPTAQSEEKGSN